MRAASKRFLKALENMREREREIDTAVRAEREACARLCEELFDGVELETEDAYQNAANNIRARGSK